MIRVSILLVFCLSVKLCAAQADTLAAPPPPAEHNMTARMVSPRVAYGEVLQSQALPRDLGGGTTEQFKMVVEDIFRKKRHVFTPDTLGVQNLKLARWVDHRYFLFVGTDYVEVTAYFLFDAEKEKLHPCVYEVGERLGYLEIDSSYTFEPKFLGDSLATFWHKP